MKKRKRIAIAGAGVVAAAFLYTGLYAWLCVLTPVVFTDMVGGETFHSPPVGYYPEYKAGDRVSEIAFWPLQKLDERLFPDRWKWDFSNRIRLQKSD